MAKPVLNKTDFVARYMRGEFGNNVPTWSSFQDWHKEHKVLPDSTRYNIRSRKPMGSCVYDLPASQVLKCWQACRIRDKDPNSLYISCMCPHELTTIQGEVYLNHCGVDFRYTLRKKPMREAFKESNHRAQGLTALGLLKANLCSNSYSWLFELLEEYPEHVVEFTTLSKPWGTVPGFNTLFWECRLY